MTLPVPYPADTKAKGWRFEIDYEKVEQSDTWTLASFEVRPWLLMLWMTAWKQVPCGSLVNDDALIAARIGMSTKIFSKHRDILLRGWWLAEDGRLYHDTVAERVLQMLDTRGADRTRQDARRTMFEQIRERDGRACVYCAHTKYLTLDHLQPISRGGGNDELNLAIACRPCNSKKKDRTPEEAGMSFINLDAADRWRRYKESAGEIWSKADKSGSTQSISTGTSTGTSTSNISSLRSDVARTTPGEVCKAMKSVGLQSVNPSHPKLQALIDAGITLEEFTDAAKTAFENQKPFAYALATAEGRRRDSATAALPTAGLNKQESLEASNAAVVARMLEGESHVAH